jgi:hypothetical protein
VIPLVPLRRKRKSNPEEQTTLFRAEWVQVGRGGEVTRYKNKGARTLVAEGGDPNLSQELKCTPSTEIISKITGDTQIRK